MESNIIIDFIIKFNNFILYYLISVNFIYTVLFVLSIRALYVHRQKNKYWSYDDMMTSSYTPPLSIGFQFASRSDPGRWLSGNGSSG